MQTIQIDFVNPMQKDEIFSLEWKLQDNEAAIIWFGLFIKCLRSENVFFPRFTGFVGGIKDEAFLLKSLSKCIEIINQDGRYHIPESATAFSQKFSNAIHHHFEILSGSFEIPSKYLYDSSEEYLAAVSGLNYCIHDLEAYTRNLESDNAFTGIIVEVRNCERFVLPDNFNKLFTMETHFGDIVLHYSQIGKTWLEAFLDNDQDIFMEAIRPHYALSGEMDIMFGKLDANEDFKNNLEKYLTTKGQNPADVNLKLGHLPVANLIRNNGLSDMDYKRQLARCCEIKSIKAFQSDDLLAWKTFSIK